MGIRIAEAITDADIAACWPVMHELRPRVEQQGFVERVRRIQKGGYRLAFLADEGVVRSCGGFRIMENLPWGRFMYVDDLITTEKVRSKGYGQQMFDWLVNVARGTGCEQMHLDSGVQRFGAHRFYLLKRMDITSHHFTLNLK